VSVAVDLSLVIPCYNEADNVETIATELWPVVDQLRRDRSVEVIFVDDGSTDGVGDLLEARFGGAPEVRVVRHDRNRGLGAALRTGFRHARGAVVVTTDSDATYPFALIPALLGRLTPDVDIVTGSCYHPQGGVADVPAYRILLSRSASLIYRLLIDRSIHTYTCMFRAYRRELLADVPCRSDGFLSVTELLAHGVLKGYIAAELPCTLRVRRYGASKAKVFRIIRSHLSFQWELIRTYGLPPRRLPRARSGMTGANAAGS
jgi:dolichol-phosphate mannosyltransferase